MSLQSKIYLMIFGMWLVNYLPRVLPMVVLSKVEIPERVITWLGFVPPAVLAAIIVPSILMPEGYIVVSWQNPYLVAAIPATVVAIKTKSLVWTLLVGMVVMAVV